MSENYSTATLAVISLIHRISWRSASVNPVLMDTLEQVHFRLTGNVWVRNFRDSEDRCISCSDDLQMLAQWNLYWSYMMFSWKVSHNFLSHWLEKIRLFSVFSVVMPMCRSFSTLKLSVDMIVWNHLIHVKWALICLKYHWYSLWSAVWSYSLF